MKHPATDPIKVTTMNIGTDYYNLVDFGKIHVSIAEYEEKKFHMRMRGVELKIAEEGNGDSGSLGVYVRPVWHHWLCPTMYRIVRRTEEERKALLSQTTESIVNWLRASCA